MRTFTFSDARSHKFWNIDLAGNSFTVTYGRVGTKGQSQTKTFADEASARKEHHKLIREKLSKGYVETTPAGSSGSLRQALEEAIIENPNERANYAAYADFLTEEGDPQGEFIQIQLSLEDESLSADQRKKLEEREHELRAKHRADWAGEWAQLAPATGPEGRGQVDFAGPKPFRFIRGVLAEVTIDELGLQCARAFVQAPQTRLVRRLFLGGYAFNEPEEDEHGDLAIPDDYVEEPGRLILPRWPHFGNLRVFQLGWTSDEIYGDFCHFQCHLGAEDVYDLVRRMPRLEQLYLFVSGVDAGKLFSLKTLKSLRILQLYHNWEYPLEKLAANPAFSRLTHLLLHPKAFGAWAEDGPYINREGVRAVLRSPHLQNLTHLRLRLTDIGDEGCEEIVRSCVLRGLKMLDLRHGCISDEGARILAACPDLKNLQLLDLSRNELTDAGIAALKAVGVPVQTEHQHGPTAPDAEREYLYEGDYE